jgi:hypothetical protein
MRKRLLLSAVVVGPLLFAVADLSNPARAQAPAAVTAKYVGAGSCAASACHGGVQPRLDSRIQQNEYSTWVVKDQHAKAHSVLGSPVSQRIARILKLGRADTSPRCLACHALNVPEAAKGRPIELADGVSCESCHGPASGWLGPHTMRDWPHVKSVQLGMYDTKDLVKRTEKCLGCHLGTPQQFVDHELIAAGHPDLVFELDSFQAVMPRHWKEPARPWRGVQTWSVGQAVQLREGLKRVAWRARGNVWPEYAELECFACHHSLTPANESWRQEVGYEGRRAGDPPFNASRFMVFQHMAAKVNPAAAQQLDQEVRKLHTLMSRLTADRDEIARTADRAAGIADGLVQSVANQEFNRDLTLGVLRAIAGDADDLSKAGERTAEQAAMAVDSLFLAYAESAKPANQAQVRAAIDGLFKELERPSAYHGPRFAAQMKRVGAALQ